MGLLENIKEKINALLSRNKIKRLNAPQQSMYEKNFFDNMVSFATPNLGEHITIREVKYINPIRHSNEKIINLMLAKVAVGKDGEREVLDDGEYVAFETEPGSLLSQELLKKIAGYYFYEKNLRNNNERFCYYIGEINDNPSDNLMKKSPTVERYIDTKIVPKIISLKTNQRLQHDASLKQKADKAIENLQVRKLDNSISNNIYIKQRRLHDEEYEKKYHDYDATKTDTGTVLRIRKLKKVCKDRNGRYIYTAFLKEAHSEDEREKVYSNEQDPVGIPVCFTLDGRFEDIVKNQNPSEMKKVLDMLSARETFDRRYDRLNYIGNVDKNGNINRDLYSNSPELINEINNLQIQFSQKMQSEEYEKEEA